MTDSPAPQAPLAWVRAGLITVVLTLQLLDVVPLPELKQHHLNHPVAKVELRRWSRTLTDWGRPTNEDDLRELGLTIGQSATRFRKAVLVPWAPFRRVTGTGQSWGLFAYPEPYSGRLTVAVHESDEQGFSSWRTLYAAPGFISESDQLESVLEYRRIRGIYDDACDRPKPRQIYKRFAAWAAHEALRVAPQASAVEIRIDGHPIVRPTEGDPVPDERRHERRFSRAELLGESP